MAVELQVVAVDSRIDITGRFNVAPKFEVHLSRDVVNKMGLADGDFIEIRGNRTTAASLLPIDKDDFSSEIIGLDNLLRKNAEKSTKIEDFGLTSELARCIIFLTYCVV